MAGVCILYLPGDSGRVVNPFGEKEGDVYTRVFGCFGKILLYIPLCRGFGGMTVSLVVFR